MRPQSSIFGSINHTLTLIISDFFKISNVQTRLSKPVSAVFQVYQHKLITVQLLHYLVPKVEGLATSKLAADSPVRKKETKTISLVFSLREDCIVAFASLFRRSVQWASAIQFGHKTVLLVFLQDLTFEQNYYSNCTVLLSIYDVQAYIILNPGKCLRTDPLTQTGRLVF